MLLKCRTDKFNEGNMSLNSKVRGSSPKLATNCVMTDYRQCAKSGGLSVNRVLVWYSCFSSLIHVRKQSVVCRVMRLVNPGTVARWTDRQAMLYTMLKTA